MRILVSLLHFRSLVGLCLVILAVQFPVLAASEMISETGRKISEVKQINDKPVVYHLGKPLLFKGIQYWGLDDWSRGKWQQDIRNFKTLGLNAVRLNIAWDHIELEEGRFEFSDLIELLKLLQDADIRVYLQFNQSAHSWKPNWFENKIRQTGRIVNALTHDGKKDGRYSFSSAYFKRYYYRYVLTTIETVKAFPNVVAYSVFTEPHFAPTFDRWLDFNPDNINAYKQWLKEKYGDIEGVNKAWHTDYSSFQTLEVYQKIPPENWQELPINERQSFFDWRSWNSEAKRRFIGDLVSLGRKVDPSRVFGQNMMWKWMDGRQAMVALDPVVNYEYADIVGINVYPGPDNIVRASQFVRFAMTIHDMKKAVWLAEFNLREGKASKDELKKLVVPALEQGATGFVYFTYRAIKAMGMDRGHYGTVCDTTFKTTRCDASSFDELRNFIAEDISGKEKRFLNKPLPQFKAGYLWPQSSQVLTYNDDQFSVKAYLAMEEKLGLMLRVINEKQFYQYWNSSYPIYIPPTPFRTRQVAEAIQGDFHKIHFVGQQDKVGLLK